MPMSFDNAAHLPQPLQAGLRHDGLKCGSHELLQDPPGARPGQAAEAQRGESSSASTSGSSSKIIKRCASTQGLADRSSMPGGDFRPTRLLSRLNPNSIRHRSRHSANTSSVVNVSTGNEVTMMSRLAAFPARGYSQTCVLVGAPAAVWPPRRHRVCEWRSGAAPEGHRSCGRS